MGILKLGASEFSPPSCSFVLVNLSLVWEIQVGRSLNPISEDSSSFKEGFVFGFLVVPKLFNFCISSQRPTQNTQGTIRTIKSNASKSEEVNTSTVLLFPPVTNSACCQKQTNVMTVVVAVVGCARQVSIAAAAGETEPPISDLAAKEEEEGARDKMLHNS